MEKNLKDIIDQHLKAQRRPFRWLAREMGRTDEGLRLGLINGSIKYTDIIKLLQLLDIQPDVLFGLKEVTPIPSSNSDKTAYKDCLELVAVLKSQLIDKDKIIALMKWG